MSAICAPLMRTLATRSAIPSPRSARRIGRWKYELAHSNDAKSFAGRNSHTFHNASSQSVPSNALCASLALRKAWSLVSRRVRGAHTKEDSTGVSRLAGGVASSPPSAARTVATTSDSSSSSETAARRREDLTNDCADSITTSLDRLRDTRVDARTLAMLSGAASSESFILTRVSSRVSRAFEARDRDEV